MDPIIKGSVSWGRQAAMDTLKQIAKPEDITTTLASLGLSLQPVEGQRCLASIAQQCVLWLTGD